LEKELHVFRNFPSKTANDAWLQVVQALKDAPSATLQPSRVGPTQEILHATLSIDNPTARWIISRYPAINPSFAFAELIWTLNGREDSAFLTYFNKKLPKMAGEGPTFHGAYGKRLRSHLGFDQLARAYRALKNNPDSRQVVLQIWDGRIDLPTADGIPTSQDIPCNLFALLKVRNGRLEWTQVMRSNDIFRGIPYDFVQFTCLQEIIAGWLGIPVGAYCHVSDSLHAYTSDLPNIFAATSDVPAEDTSTLGLSFSESEKVFSSLANGVDSIIAPSNTAMDLLSTLRDSELPTSYRDILAVITAEGLQIRGNLDLAQEAINNCANALYCQLWKRWVGRCCRTQKSEVCVDV
jgi:thymidylate synthase